MLIPIFGHHTNFCQHVSSCNTVQSLVSHFIESIKGRHNSEYPVLNFTISLFHYGKDTYGHSVLHVG